MHGVWVRHGEKGPLFNFLCNYDSIGACAGMPALCFKKTVSNNVFPFKRGSGPSESLRGACIMVKGTHAGEVGRACNLQPCLHLKFLLQKCSPAPVSSEGESSGLNSLCGRSFIPSEPKSLFAFVFPLAFKWKYQTTDHLAFLIQKLITSCPGVKIVERY